MRLANKSDYESLVSGSNRIISRFFPLKYTRFISPYSFLLRFKCHLIAKDAFISFSPKVTTSIAS